MMMSFKGLNTGIKEKFEVNLHLYVQGDQSKDYLDFEC